MSKGSPTFYEGHASFNRRGGGGILKSNPGQALYEINNIYIKTWTSWPKHFFSTGPRALPVEIMRG